MELGGKSPAVVFADADLDAAMDSTLFGVFSLNGERCTAGSRDPGRSARSTRSSWSGTPSARENDRRRRPARPRHRGRRAGPPRALRQGDELCRDRQVRGPTGRRRRPTRGLRRRATTSPPRYSPTCQPDARIFQEEIFGPVVAITPVRHRRGGARAGERRQVRPRRLHLDQRPDARAQLRAGGRGGHGVAQLATTCATCARLRRGQGVRPRPRGRLPLDRLLHRPAGRPHHPRRRPHPQLRRR